MFFLIPCLDNEMMESSWDPSQVLQGVSPDLWLRADQGVYTGGARQFYSADKGSLRIADNAALSLNGTSFTIAAWVYYDSHTAVNPGIISKDASAGNGEWSLYRATNDLALTVHNGTGYVTAQKVSGLPSNSAWYFVLGEYDGVTLSVSVNNGTAATKACAAVRASTAALNIGYFERTNEYHDGRIANAAVWKRTLTTAEKTWLYNQDSGNVGTGRVYGELGVAATDGSDLLTSLVSYWNLNETSGTANAIDQHSTNDLTPTFAELLSNTGFETAGGGGADVFGSWTESKAGTGTITDETVVVSSGSHAAKLTGADGSNYSQVSQAVLTVGHRYQYRVTARYDTTGQATVYIGSNSPNSVQLSLTGTFQEFTGTKTAVGSAAFILEVLTSGAIAYFDTVSVKAVDIPASDGPSSDVVTDTGSVGTNHGELKNFASTATAYSTDVPSAIGSGYSLSFDGVDDYVVAPGGATAISSSNLFSVSKWIKLSSIGANQLVWSSASTHYLQINSSGYINWAVGAVFRVYGSNPLSTGVWYHIAVIRTASGDNGTVYLNGVAITPTAGTIGVTPAGTDLYIGRYTTASYYFPGKIDDVRIYSTALSLSQVGELYAGNEATGATPTSKWTFDDGPPSTLVDGDPVCSWESLEGNRYQFLQAIASQRAYWRASAINSKPGLEFDSLDDLLTCVNGAVLTGGAFTTIAIWKQKTVPNSYQTLIATSDTAGATKYFALHARGNTANPQIGYEQRNADTADLLKGSDTVADEQDCAGYWSSSGTAISARLNGAAQTLSVTTGGNNGDGPGNGDTADKDNTTIGGLKHTSETNFAGVILCDLIHYPVEATAASRAIVAAYVLREYGLVL